MTHQNPIHHRDYLITAFADKIKPGEWRGRFKAEKEGERPLEQPNLASFSTEEEAEQNALAAARALIDKLFFGQHK